MIVGVAKEIKNREDRVALLPAGCRALTAAGHRVLVQEGAGLGSGFSDPEYQAAGAEVVPAATDVWDGADLVVKVKEPQESEFGLLRPGQVLFTYLHLADLVVGAALVDIAIDQGGCAETSRPNMPGAVAHTATLALTRATLPYILRLAGGWRQALADDAALRQGLNLGEGQFLHPTVAAALGYPALPFEACLS